MTKEELLKKLYHDLKNPATYAGKSKLLQEAKKHDTNISTEDVEQWSKSQLAYTLHKPMGLNFKTKPVVVHQIDEQIDLVDMSKLSKHNDGFKFIMVVIDILSKYARLEPPKSKHGIAIKNALKHIFGETIRREKVMQTNKGTEFFNVLMKTYLANNNVKLFTTHSERKAQIVERLNRTIKGIMFRYFTKENTRRYIDILQDTASQCNASYHRSIMLLKMLTKIKKFKSGENFSKKDSHKRRRKSKFSLWDFARLSIEKAPFMIRYQEIWTEEMFIIDIIVYGNLTT